jgi:hypothetical protein
MLCMALAFAFTAASASSLVNRFEHDAGIQHAHALGFGQATEDHGHQHADKDQPDGKAQSPGVGHHHADAPVAAPIAFFAAAIPQLQAPAILVAATVVTREGIGGGALKRPPRTPDIGV